MAGIFDRNYQRYDAWYDKHAHAFLSELAAIRKVLPKKGKGLEIGVGTGRFAAALGITFGVDPSRKMLALAKKRGVSVRQGYGEDIPFASGIFDYAALIITLCFVKDPAKVIKETARILKRDGRIIIGIVDKNSFLGRFYRRKKSVFYKQADFFSVMEVMVLLKAAGFRAISAYQTLSVLPDRMSAVEKLRKGYGTGGFVVISGLKQQNSGVLS